MATVLLIIATKPWNANCKFVLQNGTR